MDRALRHRVPAQVPNRANRVRAAADRHFVRGDHFLDDAADLAKTRVHAGLADSSVRRFFGGQKQLVELRIERDRKCTVDDVSYLRIRSNPYRSPACRSQTSQRRPD